MVYLIVIGCLFGLPPPDHVQSALSAVPPNNFAVTFHKARTYDGMSSWLSFDADPLASGWQAAPVGVTNWNFNGYIETGPTKDCRWSCTKVYPYASWENVNGLKNREIDPSIVLSENTRYRYTSGWTLNGSIWKGYICFSGSGCVELASQDLGTVSLERVAVGIESSPAVGLLPRASTDTNRFKDGVWYSYCYDSYEENVSSAYSTACSTSNYSWTIRGR